MLFLFYAPKLRCSYLGVTKAKASRLQNVLRQQIPRDILTTKKFQKYICKHGCTLTGGWRS